MIRFTLHELACLDAVATQGSFLAAGEKLHRSHPSVHAAVKGLEAQLGIALLDRSGYRVSLTAEGRAILARVRGLLAEAHALESFAARLARGDESDLHAVIGAVCPPAPVMALLKAFFDGCPQTRLHLHFEALSGPHERLLDEDADLIFHTVDTSDLRLDTIALFETELVPVAAPGFLPFEITPELSPLDLREQVQCVLRDSARKAVRRDHFIVEGGRSWTVADQTMKKELILGGLAWGHMPMFMIEQELASGRLLSLEGRHYRRSGVAICAARLRQRPQGPVANRLWQFLGQHRRPSLDDDALDQRAAKACSVA